MTNIDRRGWIVGAGAALAGSLAASSAAQAASGKVAPGKATNAQAANGREGPVYDYLFLDFEAPPSARPAADYAKQLSARAAQVQGAGGQLLGLFTPQLGWHAGQAALLVGWAPGAASREAVVNELSALPGVRSVRRDRLEATARPAAGDRPRAGGIYVHRWFVIETPSLDEVVSLSTLGWKDFEAKFDTNIFGLFRAAPSAGDQAGGLTRLLLLTRYGGHGVWETSRDPSTEAMAAFGRRQKLTVDTWAASTLLTPL
ncbi:hypothetical protein [Phenylobacterium sp.]|uniref:hypothetical protein n=1 Tax=Phenylobacterium sp. TaxID=1871053 RepID=UPI00301C7DE7